MASLTDERRMLLAMTGIAREPNALAPYVAKAALDALARGVTVDETLESVSSIRQQIQNSARQGVLDLASTAIRLDRYVEQAIRDGSLVQYGSEFLTRQSNRASPILRQLGIDLRRRLDAQVPTMEAGYAIVATLLQRDMADVSDAALQGLLTGLDIHVAEAVKATWDGATTDYINNIAKTVLTLANGSTKAAIQDLMTFKATSYEDIYPGDGQLPNAQLSAAMQGLQVGASVVYSALSLFGASDQANFVRTAAGYAQSAVQIQQSLALLAGATTGVGAVMAVSGLLGGLGNAGILGASPDFNGGQTANDAQHREVMNAIEELAKTMQSEFRQVNAKLDDLMTAALAIVGKINAIGQDIQEIKDIVKRTEVKIDLLTLRVEQAEASILAALKEQEDRTWRNRLVSGSPLSDVEVSAALSFYEDCVNDAILTVPAINGTPIEQEAKLSAAFDLVRDVFGDEESPNNALFGKGLTALATLLRAWKIVSFTEVADSNLLRHSIQQFGLVRECGSIAFGQLQQNPLARAERDAQVASLRGAIAAYDAWALRIRTQVDAPGISDATLRTAYRATNSVYYPANYPGGPIPTPLPTMTASSKLLQQLLSAYTKISWILLGGGDALGNAAVQSAVSGTPIDVIGVEEQASVFLVPHQPGDQLITILVTGALSPAERARTAAVFTCLKNANGGVIKAETTGVGLHTRTIHQQVEDTGFGTHTIILGYEDDSELTIDFNMGDQLILQRKFRGKLYFSTDRPVPATTQIVSNSNAYFSAGEGWQLFLDKIKETLLSDEFIQLCREMKGAQLGAARDISLQFVAQQFSRVNKDRVSLRIPPSLSSLDAWSKSYINNGEVVNRNTFYLREENLLREALAAIEDIGSILVLLRATLRVTFEELYALDDRLDSMFSENIRTGIVGPKFIKLWGETVIMLTNGSPIDEESHHGQMKMLILDYDAIDRWTLLKDIIIYRYDQLVEHCINLHSEAIKIGRPLVFEFARRRFDEAYPLTEFP